MNFFSWRPIFKGELFFSGSVITHTFLSLHVCFLFKAWAVWERKLQLCQLTNLGSNSCCGIPCIMENMLVGFDKLYTHRIHGTYIFAYIWLVCLWQFLVKNVGKYSTQGPYGIETGIKCSISTSGAFLLSRCALRIFRSTLRWFVFLMLRRMCFVKIWEELVTCFFHWPRETSISHVLQRPKDTSR